MQNKADWKANAQQVSLKGRLADAWEAAHVLQSASLADKFTAKVVPGSKCLKSGMCLCSGKGKHANMLHDNLVSYLRPLLITRMSKAEKEAAKKAGMKRRKTVARRLLESSSMCLRLSPAPKIRLDAAGGPALSSDDEGEDGEDPDEDFWLHTSYSNFKDMQFSLLRLHRLPEKQRLAPPGMIALSVVGTPVVARSQKCFQDLDLDRSWSIRFYKIFSDAVVVGQEAFAPDIVEVQEVSASVLPGLKVWGGLEQELANRRGKASQQQRRRRTATGVKPSRAKQASSAQRAGSGEDVPMLEMEDVPEEENEKDGDSLSSRDGSSDAASDGQPWMQLVDVSELLGAAPEEVTPPTGSDGIDVAPDAAAASMHGDVAPDAAAASMPGEAPVVPERKRPTPTPASRVKLVTEEVFNIYEDGKLLGSLRHNPRTSTITAWCEAHESCRKQRTCLAGQKRGQGRPIGFLICWLQDAKTHESQQSHVHASTAGSQLADRQRGRALFLSHTNAATFAQHERLPKEGEPAEPEVFS